MSIDESAFLHENASQRAIIGGERQWDSGQCHGHPAREGGMAKMAMAQGRRYNAPPQPHDVLEIERVSRESAKSW
jgi:hypothetical protein